MGAWSTSITGNDTAQDLRAEYTCAFYYYKDISEAVQKIEGYVTSIGINETDPEEYCDYVYSLADFMWKKGILTDEIRDRALKMIDSGFGLEIWEESGVRILKARQKALEKFRTQITSPMCAPQKIKLNINAKEIFEKGDLIAIKLMTSGKNYIDRVRWIKDISEEEFQRYDGKYILVQKIEDHYGWTSSIVPEIKSCWAIFKLFDGVYDEIPSIDDISTLKESIIVGMHTLTSLFLCDSSMFYFKKRKYEVLGNYAYTMLKDDSNDIIHFQYKTEHIFLGINKPWYNPDSVFVSAFGNTIRIEEVKDYNSDTMRNIVKGACMYWTLEHNRLSREEKEQRLKPEIDEYVDDLENAARSGAHMSQAFFNEYLCGVIAELNGEIRSLFALSRFQGMGFGTRLVKHCIEEYGVNSMYIPPKALEKRGYKLKYTIGDALKKICERSGIDYHL